MNYKTALKDWLMPYMKDISELSRQRIANNDILKILDSKRIEDVEIMNLKERPLINQYWNKESKQRIHNVVNMLKDKNIVFEKGEDRNGSEQKGIELVWDNTLVRGLDYYCHTTFEFVECKERKEERKEEKKRSYKGKREKKGGEKGGEKKKKERKRGKKGRGEKKEDDDDETIYMYWNQCSKAALINLHCRACAQHS